MKFWDDIINRASLGSTKLPLRSADLPSEISEEYALADSGETEEDFLKYSSLVYQFRQSGTNPLDLKNITQTEARPEENKLCSAESHNVLHVVLQEELYHFVGLWLTCCNDRQQLAQPAIIPTLLDLAVKRKELRKQIIKVTGKRGEWLAAMNPGWNALFVSPDSKASWDTGTFDERKEVLRSMREQNPSEALAWLQSTWSAEGANEKIAFLEILSVHLSEGDVPWLESLKEKGQKVNNAVVDLLKSSPSSTITKEYISVLEKAISLKSSKALLGMISKTTLQFDESFAFPESIFKTGIEKLSSNKNISDGQHILSQIISCVPPSFFSNHFQLSIPDVIDLVKKEKKGFYIQSLAQAAIRHRDVEWIRALLDDSADELSDVSVVNLIDALPAEEKDRYALKYIKEKPMHVTELMTRTDREWSVDLAKAILKYTASEIYQYNRTFYRPVTALIPVSILDSLESFTPNEEQKKVYWKNQADELSRLLTIKKQLLQSFNA